MSTRNYERNHVGQFTSRRIDKRHRPKRQAEVVEQRSWLDLFGVGLFSSILVYALAHLL